MPDVLTFRELARLKGLNGLARWIEFMRIWTLKEACAKAMGLGVSFDFRRMEVETRRAKVRLVDRPPDGVWRSRPRRRRSSAAAGPTH